MDIYNIIDEKGRRIQLANEISVYAAGGEGKLYYINGMPGMVAKIFNDESIGFQKEEKLRKMLLNPPVGSKQKPADGLVRIAWPVSILYNPGGRYHNRCVGFIMPFFKDTIPLDCLIHPSRRAEYHLTDPGLPAVAAYNLASVMSYLHANSYIIGDVSADNFMVDTDGHVFAVDTDSYQLEGSECTVNHPDYCPKEYIDARDSKRRISYTEEGDRFGLAKLIFQLLMNGFDAHQGRDPYLQNAIEINIHCVQNGIFPYKNDKNYSPSPLSPSYENVVPEDIRQLFERCFCEGALVPQARPKSQEWTEPLLRLVDRIDNDNDFCNWYIIQLRTPYAKSTPFQGQKVTDEEADHYLVPIGKTEIDTTIKVLPVVICLDISESMKTDGRIYRLNAGLGDLIRSLKSHPKAKNMVELEIITFGGAPKVLLDFTPVLSVTSPVLQTVDGYTPLYGTLQKAFYNIQQYSQKLSEEGRTLRRPIIMIMTDGEPTGYDERVNVLKTVNFYRSQAHKVNSVDVVAVGIGKNYNPMLLDELCTKNWVVELYKGQPELLQQYVDNYIRGLPFAHINLFGNGANMVQFFNLFSDSVTQSVNG